MSNTTGAEVSFNIDETKIGIVTRAQRLGRVALKFLYAVRGVPETEAMSFGYAKMPEVVEAEQQLEEALTWLEGLGTRDIATDRRLRDAAVALISGSANRTFEPAELEEIATWLHQLEL